MSYEDQACAVIFKISLIGKFDISRFTKEMVPTECADRARFIGVFKCMENNSSQDKHSRLWIIHLSLLVIRFLEKAKNGPKLDVLLKIKLQ